MSELADPKEPVRIKLAESDPRLRQVTLPEYWLLFWVPVLGPVPSLLYQFLTNFLSAGRPLPTKGDTLAYLNLTVSELREAVSTLSKMRLLEPSPTGEGSCLIFPPPVMSGDFAKKQLPEKLRPLHTAYLESCGYEVSELPIGKLQQLDLLDDGDLGPITSTAIPQVSKAARKTSPESQEIVEHFKKRIREKSQMPNFEIHDYGAERIVANKMLKLYQLEGTLRIIDAFFEYHPNPASISSLRQIRDKDGQIYERLAHNLSVAPVFGNNSQRKIITAPVKTYGKVDKDKEEEGGEW